MSTNTTDEKTTVTMLTAWECAKVVNTKLAVDLPEKKALPAQMFYTYVSKGYIKSTNKLVNIDDLREWYKTYLVNAKQRMTRENRELPTI